ncbi:MAG TPA: DUF6427 family protein [Bacteroidales bacterium]|jgi:hypothetical protein|nr:hypothetical protein [Bacteroidales bacterium]OQB63052.1 MAG: hypothetical protein BWX96_01267 [Bacteroidetes bacterium ADurb.Bin145]HOU01492.1 DUF6427 family protein [Bacteroidales bacterium]HQG63762.1 DUF6427 family protein [Bacteroidales bacterium]HQK67653.1 DUF6427 family protein [Bacteroidales bacterium]
MFLRIFKGTDPGVIVLLILTLGLMWIGAFLNPQSGGSFIYETRPMPLYSLLKFLLGGKQLAGTIFIFILVPVILFLISTFNTTVFFINERTFLPVVLYLLLTAVFPVNQKLNPVLPAALFLLMALMRIMDAYRKQGVAYNFFDAGILISIGSLFYANLIWFGILLFAGIAMLRTINFSEAALSLLGLATPFIVVTGLYYVVDKDLLVLLSDFTENLFKSNPGYVFDRLTVVALIYAALILLISLGFLSNQLNVKKIKARKTYFLLFWVFGISLLLYFFLPSVSIEIMWLTGIPSCYIMAHYFVFVKKKLVPEIFFSGLFVIVLLIQIMNIF